MIGIAVRAFLSLRAFALRAAGLLTGSAMISNDSPPGPSFSEPPTGFVPGTQHSGVDSSTGPVPGSPPGDGSHHPSVGDTTACTRGDVNIPERVNNCPLWALARSGQIPYAASHSLFCRHAPKLRDEWADCREIEICARVKLR